MPRSLTVGEFQLDCQIVSDGDARAGHAIAEAEHPHPSAIKHVMQRRIIHRIW